MATVLSHSQRITDTDPPVLTHVSTRSVTVIVAAGAATVDLGVLSPDVAMVKQGETATWSVFAISDFLEPFTITALGAGADVHVIWTRI